MNYLRQLDKILINWITEKVGTCSWNEAASKANGDFLLDVRDLVDKSGNREELIRLKLNQGLEELGQNKKVIVCCDYGLSRSNAIAVGILSHYLQIPFESALKLVIEKVDASYIKLPVLAEIRTVTEKLTSHNEQTIIKNTTRTLITGGHGFIGKAFRNYVGESDLFFAPTSNELDLEKDSITLDAMVRNNKVRTILHLATPKVYTSNDAMAASLLMLKNTLDVCLVNKCRLVFLSGWEVFSGYYDVKTELAEDTPPYPAGVYGQTKMLCEALLRHFEEKYQLQISIVRPSPVYSIDSAGPRFLWNFYDKARKNADIYAHKYLNDFPRLDFLHVNDLLSLLIKVLNSDFKGTINVGTGKLTSTSEIARFIIDETGSKSRILHREIEDKVGNIILDTSSAKRIFNWSAKIMPEDGIRKMIQEKIKTQSLSCQIV